MKSVLLVYNVKDENKKKALSGIFGFLGFKLKAVDRAEYNLPLGVLTGMDTANEKSSNEESANYTGEGFEDEMLVIQSSNEEVLDKALFLMKEEKISIGLKAMITPTNKDWTTLELYAEIKREHEYMKNRERKQ